MSDSEEEEIIIENDDDDVDDDDVIDPVSWETTVKDFSSLLYFQECAQSLLPAIKTSVEEGVVKISIPTEVLPLQQLVVYGYNVIPVLLNIEMTFLETPNFQSKPSKPIQMSNALHGKNFIGKPRLELLIQNFFSPKYSPKPTYDCLPILFDNKGRPNKILKFIERIPNYGVPYPIPYSECPLIYFILEVIDTYLSLTHTCSICGRPLSVPVLKPSLCNDQKCQFALKALGLGNSLIQEIKRDPAAADFIFSAFANAFGTEYLNPKPPQYITNCATNVFQTLPPMRAIANQYSSDAELFKFLGNEAVELLRYILFSNRNQFLLLPDRLKLKDIPAQYQFMTICSTQEAEVKFQNLKDKYGSQLLWHGSHSDRWHAIFHNGLINASGTKYQANGRAYGDGIYFAMDSSMSWGYVRSCQNAYTNSMFRDFSCIALCEVANVPELKNHGSLCTLTNEAACVVRFLFLGTSFSKSFSKRTPNLPTLQQIQNEIIHRK